MLFLPVGCLAQPRPNDQVIHDMPTDGKRVDWHVDARPRRRRCLGCGKIFMGSLPAVNAKREMTDRPAKWIDQHTLASLAEEVGSDEKTVRNLFRTTSTTWRRNPASRGRRGWGRVLTKPPIRARCVISHIRTRPDSP